MNHGSASTYKMTIFLPIEWIIGVGAIFISLIEKTAKT